MTTNKFANIYSPYGIVTERKTHTEVAGVFSFYNIKSIHILTLLKLLLDISAPDTLLQHEELHPLFYNILMILADECLCSTLVFFWQWLCSFLFTNMNLDQLSVHHDEVEDTFLSSMKHMHVNRLMLIRIKIKDKTEVFKYLGHVVEFTFVYI